MPDLGQDDILDALRRDKKVERGSVRFVLSTGIGKTPVIKPIDEDTIVRELGRDRIG
jgi:3-dehydroquinate synthetase